MVFFSAIHTHTHRSSNRGRKRQSPRLLVIPVHPCGDAPPQLQHSWLSAAQKLLSGPTKEDLWPNKSVGFLGVLCVWVCIFIPSIMKNVGVWTLNHAELLIYFINNYCIKSYIFKVPHQTSALRIKQACVQNSCSLSQSSVFYSDILLPMRLLKLIFWLNFCSCSWI